MKYLLDLKCEKHIAEVAKSQRLIKQGYLVFTKGMSLRIRSSDDSKYELTFKRKVRGRVIEIEQKLNARDFNDLWSVAVNRLEKIRYDVVDKKEVWEVDAFKDHNHETYIVVAEHEMPEGVLEPKRIPVVIKNQLIYSVRLDDDRFASKKLADVKYSKKLYEEIRSHFCDR